MGRREGLALLGKAIKKLLGAAAPRVSASGWRIRISRRIIAQIIASREG